MKELNLNQMEKVAGGNFIDGACAVFGLSTAGIAARVLIGASLAIPGWGQAVLAVGTIGCLTYRLLT
jgi:hypothetical protein